MVIAHLVAYSRTLALCAMGKVQALYSPHVRSTGDPCANWGTQGSPSSTIATTGAALRRRSDTGGAGTMRHPFRSASPTMTSQRELSERLSS